MNDRPISLTHLNQIELDMLNKIWSYKTKSELRNWFDKLPQEDKDLANRLMQRLVEEIRADSLEELVETSDLSEANKLISKIKG